MFAIFSNELKNNKFVKTPTITPMDEIIPNSERPIYFVGINDKKPMIDEMPTIKIEKEKFLSFSDKLIVWD